MPIDERKLYRIDRALRAAGMAPLTREELIGIAQQLDIGEGGFINDQTGQATQHFRENLLIGEPRNGR